MINLHFLEFDETGNLILEYERAGDGRDFWFDSYFDDLDGFDKKDSNYVLPPTPEKSLVISYIKGIVAALEKRFGPDGLEVGPLAQKLLNEGEDEDELFHASLQKGGEIKQQIEHNPQLSKNFIRDLKDYQKMPVEHMIRVGNAANFSVPGSGKTTMAYAALSRSLEDKTIQKILVIGPTASFVPWQEEYQECFGKAPRKLVVRGDDARDFSERGDIADLFLMHFQTAINIVPEIKIFFQKWDTALIIDESHYIKNPNLERRYNSMALSISKEAKRRIVLSGTPMPKDERDLWNQITCLWPNNDPLDKRWVYDNYVKNNGFGKYQNVLDSLYTRVTKSQLGLPDWNFIPRTVRLEKHQREIYDAIAAKMLKDIKGLTFSDKQFIQNKRRAALIRLLQTASNPALIYRMAAQFNIKNKIFAEQFGLPQEETDPGLLGKVDDLPLADKIKNYEELGEIPSKISYAADLAKKIMEGGQKVIIWSSFIKNMELFETQILKDVNPIIVNGTVPRQTDNNIERWKDQRRQDGLSDKTREERIQEFKNDKDPRVLIASAASLGESVSLHKNLRGDEVCSNAIYLDRNFNAAQFMQSVDRIHRIGMNEKTEPRYYLLIGERTIDENIHLSLKAKWERMLDVLNDPLLRRLGLDVEAEVVDNSEIESINSALVKHLNKYFS